MKALRKPRLLVFNLMVDADDPILGFATVWLNALAARCKHIDVITMQTGLVAVADNVRVYSVGKEKGYSEPRRALEFYRLLFRLLRQNRYDACFTHMIQLFAVMGAPLLKIWRVPVTLWYTHKAVSPMLRLAEKTVDHVVTASAESFRIPSRKTQVVGHGIDTNLFRPANTPDSSNHPFRLVTAGRIAPVKRLDTMIAAVKTLVDDSATANIHLRIVGNTSAQDTDYAVRLHELVNEYRLSQQVEFAGAVTYEHMAQEYQQADVMVNMSATGGVDKAVLEAMACGLPVVTANEAFQVMLAPWGDQLLVPPEAPEELAARLKLLMSMTPGERAKLGAELRELVIEQHSLDRLVDKLLAIF